MANQVAYGFHELQDIFDKRAVDVSADVISEAIQMSTEMYNRDLQAILAAWVRDWDGKPQKQIELPTGGELQPLSENGVPQVTRGGANYTQATPLMRGGDAFGFNRESYAKATVGEMNNEMLRIQKKDAAWNIRRILAAVFTNTTWTYKDEEYGNLSIKGLANSGGTDTDQYPDLNGDFATDDHYLAQANSIGDGSDNPFPTIYEELYHHPENMGPFVAMIPNGLKSSVTALSNFYEAKSLNPMIDYGDNTSLAVDAAEQYLAFGTRVLGVVDDIIVVESRRMPANYIVTYAAGSGAFVRRRQPMESNLQGLRSVEIQVNSNFRRTDFYRIAGYSAYNRVGAVVMRIGNGSYAIPTGYDASTLAG